MDKMFSDLYFYDLDAYLLLFSSPCATREDVYNLATISLLDLQLCPFVSLAKLSSLCPICNVCFVVGHNYG